MKTKLNNAGEQQPYISSGNGKKSGQYTFKNSVFLESEKCDYKNLCDKLSPAQMYAIRQYSIYTYGKILNKKIRENRLTNIDELMVSLILVGISQHKLRNDITVFRGINVSNDIYLSKFYNKYEANEIIDGSLICSTSRNENRAINASIGKESSSIAIVFEIPLLKNDYALPIEDIAISSKEEEILLAKPTYKIQSIKHCKVNNFKYLKIKIKLERKKENENQHL